MRTYRLVALSESVADLEDMDGNIIMVSINREEVARRFSPSKVEFGRTWGKKPFDHQVTEVFVFKREEQ